MGYIWISVDRLGLHYFPIFTQCSHPKWWQFYNRICLCSLMRRIAVTVGHVWETKHIHQVSNPLPYLGFLINLIGPRSKSNSPLIENTCSTMCSLCEHETQHAVVKVFTYVVVDIGSPYCQQNKHCGLNKQLFSNSASHSHHFSYCISVDW